MEKPLTYQFPTGSSPHAFDVLCPNHIVLNTVGQVLGCGPSVVKYIQLGSKADFFDHFDIRRPRGIISMSELITVLGKPLRICLQRDSKTELRAVAARLSRDLFILNFSVGIGLDRAVQTYALTEKDFAPTDLAIEMLYLLEAKRAVTEANVAFNRKLYGAKIAAEEQALTDTLTGLKNRRALENALQSMVAKGHHFSTVQMDLDYFKRVNDTFGHAAGDHVLKVVAEILRKHLRDQDIVVRLGGDEFVLIFSGLTDQRQIGDICERIILAIEQPINFEGQNCQISSSMGIFSVYGGHVDPADILLNADIALYHAKRAGRGQFKFFATRDYLPE